MCFLYQGKEVCLWFLISSAPHTPADPPPFIPYQTCKTLDLWLAVLMSVCVCTVCEGVSVSLFLRIPCGHAFACVHATLVLVCVSVK